jgi:hypothetical protein
MTQQPSIYSVTLDPAEERFWENKAVEDDVLDRLMSIVNEFNCSKASVWINDTVFTLSLKIHSLDCNGRHLISYMAHLLVLNEEFNQTKLLDSKCQSCEKESPVCVTLDINPFSHSVCIDCMTIACRLSIDAELLDGLVFLERSHPLDPLKLLRVDARVPSSDIDEETKIHLYKYKLDITQNTH